MSRRSEKTAHFDPRIGDEDDPDHDSDIPQIHEPKSVSITPSGSGTATPRRSEPPGEKVAKDDDKPNPKKRSLPEVKLPQSLQWIPSNWTWSKLKPVIRSALSQWISLVLVVINPSLRAMGQVRDCTVVPESVLTSECPGRVFDSHR